MTRVTIKLSLFAGLFTWFTLVATGGILPYTLSIVTAILAPFPVLPTYMTVVLPTVELFLRGEQTVALLLFTAHFLAYMFLIPMFYTQIEGQHPYMTGLSVIGGLYAFGFDGVVIG